MARQHFCPEDDFVPPLLRARIESWQDHLPSTQFQQYGPLDRYFNLAFNRHDQLVKPQALFRVPIDQLDSDLLQNFPGDQPYVPDDPDLLDNLEDLQFQFEQGEISIDSTHTGHVWRTQEGKSYPDFAICKYVADAHAGDERDRVLVVVEVASVPQKARNAAMAKAEEYSAENKVNNDDEETEDNDNKDDDEEDDEEDNEEDNDDADSEDDDDDAGNEEDDAETDTKAGPARLKRAKEELMIQLLTYMEGLGEDGERWEGNAIGIGIIGTEVAFFQRNYDPNEPQPWVRFRIADSAGGEDILWFSLYGPEFRDFIMTMQTLP